MFVLPFGEEWSLILNTNVYYGACRFSLLICLKLKYPKTLITYYRLFAALFHKLLLQLILSHYINYITGYVLQRRGVGRSRWCNDQ